MSWIQEPEVDALEPMGLFVPALELHVRGVVPLTQFA